MALRLPATRRPTRSQSSAYAREIVTVGISSFLFVMFLLRLILKLTEIEPWITTWRLVAVATYPLAKPLMLIDAFQRSVAGDVTIADLISFILISILTLYLIASLTVRQRR